MIALLISSTFIFADVIHAVGPRAGSGGPDMSLLQQTYTSVLNAVINPQNGIRTVAIPSISTGIYGM